MNPVSSQQKTNRGSTLVLAIFVVALLAVFIGVAFEYTTNTARMMVRAASYSSAQALGNGALEAAFLEWRAYMQGNQANRLPLSPTDPLYKHNFTRATLVQAAINQALPLVNAAAKNSGFYVVSLTINPVDRADNPMPSHATSLASLGPLKGVPGWTSTNYSFCATAVVSRILNPSLGAGDPNYYDHDFTVSSSRFFELADASLFQAMLFFQDDLELHPGPAMTLYGLVHTNANLYAAAGSGGSLTFISDVSYHGNKDTLEPRHHRQIQ